MTQEVTTRPDEMEIELAEEYSYADVAYALNLQFLEDKPHITAEQVEEISRKESKLYSPLTPSATFAVIRDAIMRGRDWHELLEMQPDVANVESVYAMLETTGEKAPRIAPTLDNFLKILRYDRNFANIRRNALTRRVEVLKNGKARPITDGYEGQIRRYIEREYGIKAKDFDFAFAEFLEEREHNPLLQKIESVTWDGKPHCRTFLSTWTGCPADTYSTECSRLLFAGAIHRLKNPGVKFDYSLVLVGDQGSGKSTLCSWLALDDDYFVSLGDIRDRKAAAEKIRGKWICELGELLAKRDEKATKDFLTQKQDTYRPAYGKNTIDQPRSCIFIATTNDEKFLGDATGERRWLPIRMRITETTWRTKILPNEATIRNEILQAYAEMLAAYQCNDDLATPYAPAELLQTLNESKKEFELEDWRILAIEDYIDSLKRNYRTNDEIIARLRISIEELYQNALHPDEPHLKHPDHKESMELANIIKFQLADKWQSEKGTAWHRGKSQKVYSISTLNRCLADIEKT